VIALFLVLPASSALGKPLTVTLDTPGAGPVAGTIAVAATAGDDSVDRVEFRVRGALCQPEGSSKPAAC
jgi:hypothetical protein